MLASDVRNAPSFVDQAGPFTWTRQLLEFACSATVSESPHLLDVRCGSGNLIAQFAARGWRVTGLDGASGFASTWRELADDFGGEFVVADAFDAIPNELRAQQFDLIVGFDDSAVELSERHKLTHLLQFAVKGLTDGGHLVFQMDRRPGWTVHDSLRACRDAGFSDAWRASIIDMSQAIDQGLDHRGSRDLIVARR